MDSRPRNSAYHGAVGDQTDQRIRRQKRQAHDERVLERLQAVILLASVHDIHKDRGGGRSSQLILDRSTRRVELGGYRVLRDVLVVRREGVTHQTEGTNPDPRADVDGANTMVN